MADNPDRRVEREEDPADRGVEGLDMDRARNAMVPAGDRHRQAEAAVALRIAGANWSEIARALDFHSATAARNAVERILAESVSEEDREQGRWMMQQRLLRVMRSLYPRATLSEFPVDENGERITDENGNPVEPLYDHLGYAKVYLSYIDRRVKLYGLDAPTELNVAYSPRAEELQRAVAETVAEIRGHFPEEADILDAEVISEED